MFLFFCKAYGTCLFMNNNFEYNVVVQRYYAWRACSIHPPIDTKKSNIVNGRVKQIFGLHLFMCIPVLFCSILPYCYVNHCYLLMTMNN